MSDVHSREAVMAIARIMAISYEEAAKFCEDVRKLARAKITTDGQIYQCIRHRKTEWTPEAVARYTDGHALRIRQMVGPKGKKAIKRSRSLYKRQLYVYCTSSTRATVHIADCTSCNYGRGTNSRSNRGWHGPYETRSAAMIEARRLAKNVHLCERCGGALGIDDIYPEVEE